MTDAHPSEEWRIVPSDPVYEVSTLGRVRRRDTGRMLKPEVMPSGYLRVEMREAGAKRQRHRVHRLVCEVFHGPPPTPAHEVAHADGSRDNNVASNLRWATRAENQADRVLHGTDLRGGKSPNAKFSDIDVMAMLRLRQIGATYRSIALAYRVSFWTVREIGRRQRWAHIVVPPFPSDSLSPEHG